MNKKIFIFTLLLLQSAFCTSLVIHNKESTPKKIFFQDGSSKISTIILPPRQIIIFQTIPEGQIHSSFLNCIQDLIDIDYRIDCFAGGLGTGFHDKNVKTPVISKEDKIYKEIFFKNIKNKVSDREIK